MFERNERLNNYGTYGVWRELHKANKGAALVLPETLGAIAKATYGDAMKYKTIFERNADCLVNAKTIYEGQVIVLPAK